MVIPEYDKGPLSGNLYFWTVRLFFICVSIAALLSQSCRPRTQYTSRPAKTLPDQESPLPEVNAVAFHNNDSLTTVYLEVSNENLLYKRPDTSRAFYTHLRVHFRLTAGSSRKLLDSSSYMMHDRAEGEQVPVRPLYSYFRVRAKRGDSYELNIDIFDINRRTRYTREIPVNKDSRLGPQNFLVMRNDTVAFHNHFLRAQDIRVVYAGAPRDSLFVDCFTKVFGPAPPPFSTREPDPVKYKPDSAYSVKAEGNSIRIRTLPSGFCQVKADRAVQEGFSVFTYDEHFPGVGSSEEMIHCARYIMNREEYESCLSAPDKKAAIDKFWLTVGGSNERARELLKRYYGRVKEANKFYTSYTQGWKTDRGMIYVVFGQPANIYRSRKDEVWVYGNEANPAALRFVFNKTKNPFSDNDYVMERSQFYKDPWYGAVDYWRQGHVYFEGRR